MGSQNCQMSEGQVAQAFAAAPPLISQSIIDLTIKHPNWMRDLFEVEEWPRGNGTIMEQLVFRGLMPKIETDLSAWKEVNNNTGCEPCEGPDCAYNWTQFGGSALERKVVRLNERAFRSPAYCVKEIQTTAHYEQFFAKNVENLYRQIDFFKEFNIGQLLLTSLAKKLVVDSGGAKANTANIYAYPNIGSVSLSTLNITMLEYFYEYLRMLPEAVPYDQVNGAPVFALECSSQLLSHLYRDDPELRQDVRFSGLANDLVSKYNFMSTIRGMYIAAPILTPRRFKIVAGEPIQIMPYLNGVPGEVGSYTDLNPDYVNQAVATHEEVILHGKYPFKIFFMPTEQTLGQNTSFGPEFSWFNSWSWVNPMTIEDPGRRVGYFWTSATLGFAPQFSKPIYAILVPRPPVGLMVSFFPSTTCPPTDPVCSNEIAATDCPCPLILSFSQNPITTTQFYFTLATPSTANAMDSVQLGLDNGSYLTGTVAAVSTDAKTLAVTFGAGTDLGTCDHFTTIFCDNTLGCSSEILSASDCRSFATDDVVLYLKNPIKAVDAGDQITATFGNGTTATLDVVSVDFAKNAWTVRYHAGQLPSDGANAPTSADMLCDRQGIVLVCVPTATDATCPACGGVTYTECA